MEKQSRYSHTLEESADGIKVLIRHQKNNHNFAVALTCLIALIIVILIGIVSLITWSRQGVTAGTYWLPLLVTGLVIAGLVIGMQQALDNAFLQEKLEVNGSAITVERSGFLMFRKKKVIPAKWVKKIQPVVQITAPGSKLADFLINTTKYGKLSIATRQRLTPYYDICRGISADDAATILDRILDKYPQY